MSRPRLRRVHVVVPARDEEARLGACLRSVLTAAQVLRRTRTCAVEVTVVLDSCRDDSAAVAAGFPGVRVLTVEAGVVGVARHRGVVSLPEADGAATTWVACTDADTVVPRRWLVTQVALADAGADLVVGTVTPDPAELSVGDLVAWHALHRLSEGHPFVHGANLGFMRAAYDLVGGFAPLATGEDVDLVERMQAAGLPWRATDRTRVRTSGRWAGRAPEGFAEYLRDLHDVPPLDGVGA